MISKDIGHSIWYYISNITVVCPKCSKSAIIKNPNKSQNEPVLKCNHCFYSKSGFEFSTSHNIQKVVCQKCDSIFNLETKNLPQTVKKTNYKCNECNFMNQIEVEFELSNHGGMLNSNSKDQYYGLDFWYQMSFKNNRLWAFNLEHLNDIEDYVKADLRKRHEGDFQSMLEKLPKWITSKKNRTDIMKAIKKLKGKTA